MPTAWKKAKLGGIPRLLVSSLRSKAKNGVGDSPLVVQAGFPTSVADFVVKNRSRLKKTPRWRRPPSPSGDGGNAGCSTMAVLASEIVAAAVGSSSDDDALLSSPRDTDPQMGVQGQRPPVAEKCRKVGSVIGEEVPNSESHRGLLGSEAPEVDGPQAVPMVAKKLLKVEGFGGVRQLKAAKDGVDQRIPTSKAEKDEAFLSFAPSQVPETESPEETWPSELARRGEAYGAPSAREGTERKVLGGGGSGGFMVVAKMAFILLVLAVVSRKIAIAVSALAFAMLLAESVGKRLILLMGPCEEAKKKLGAIPGSGLIAGLAQTLGGSASNVRGRIPILSPSIGEPGLDPSLPERNRVAQAPAVAAAPAVETTSLALAEKGSLKIEGCWDDQESSIASRKEEKKKKKKKKLFGNIGPNKFRGSKGGKGEGKLGPPSRGQAPTQKGVQQEAMEEEEVEEKDDGDDDEPAVPAMDRDSGLGKPSKGSSEHMVFLVLILFGLVGGRVVALFLTVGALCVSSAKSLWEGWNSDRSLKALPGASTLDGLLSGRKV